METLLIVMRLAQFASAMALFGSSLFALYARPGEAMLTDMSRFQRRLALAASGIALLSALGWLGCEAALMSGQGDGYRDPAILATVLGQTRFGRLWRWRLAMLAVLFAAQCGRAWPSRRLALWSAVLLATLAGVGHGALGTGAMIAQALHLLAGGAWVGGLLPLLWLVRHGRDGRLLVKTLDRFSGVGLAAALLVIGSGFVNSWLLVGSLDALLQTAYGHVLLLKLAFVTAMLGLALFNRFRLMPALRRRETDSRATRRLGWTIALEQVCALLALTIVSVLGQMSPPFAMPGMMM